MEENKYSRLCCKCGKGAGIVIHQGKTYCLIHYLERRRLERRVGDEWVDLIEMAEEVDGQL